MADEFATLDEAALKVNLSYVLHEASTSRAVHQSWRASRRFLRQKKRILQRFRAASDTELAKSLFVPPRLEDAISNLKGPAHYLTASVGLPELLGRALQVNHPQGASEIATPGTLVDLVSSPPEYMYVQFFRALGELATPAFPADCRAVVAAGLIVRPDEGSLLLTGEIFDVHPRQLHGNSPLTPSMIATLERIIRDYVDQWNPQRRLWQKPAESTLPELGIRDRGT